MPVKMVPQDTLKLKQADGTYLTGQKQDTLPRKNADTVKTISPDTTVKKVISKIHQDVKAQNKEKIDTSIENKKLSTDFTNKKTSDIINYYLSDYKTVTSEGSNICFPYFFIESSQKLKKDLEIKISEVAKNGIKIEKDTLKSDWMLPVMLISLLVYIILGRAFSDSMKLIKKFFTFRIAHDSGTTKTLRFSSTLLDLISYVNISLYGHLLFTYFNIGTGVIKGYFAWIIIFISTIFLSLARQSVTFLTGEISEQKEIFMEYGRAISCFYRSTGLILFFIIIILLYTNFFNTKTIIYSGFFIVIFIYVIRIVNLFTIFIKRSASILYLILYLCALEILPVAILIKFLKQLLQNIQ